MTTRLELATELDRISDPRVSKMYTFERQVLTDAACELRGDDPTLARQRTEFEAAIMALHRKLDVFGHCEEAASSDDPELVFWRQADGTYGVRQWNAAWWAWCAARGLK